MGKPTGFLEFTREAAAKKSGSRKNKKLINEFVERFSDAEVESASCTVYGLWCSVLSSVVVRLGNIIPEFNDAVYREELERSL